MADDPVLIQGGITDQDRLVSTKDRDFRPKLYDVVPVTRTPLCSLLSSKLGTTKTTQNKYEWGEQPFNTQSGDITDVYTDSGLATPYASGATAFGSAVFIKMAAADAKQFLVKDNIIVHSGVNALSLDITAVTIAGASSYLTAQAISADTDLVLAGTSLYYSVGSRSDSQISALPEAIYQEPALFDNYTQDFMVACELSDREIAAKELIDPSIRTRNKMQGLVRMNRYVESMIREGVKYGPGNRTWSGGYAYWLKTKAGGNIIDLKTDTTYMKGQNWQAYTLEALYAIEEKISRFNQSGEYWVIGGGLALASIVQCIREQGCYELSPTQTKFGVRYKTLTGMNTSWNLVQDPSKSTHKSDVIKRSIDVLDTSLMELREFRPLKYIPAGTGVDGYTYKNGEKSGWEWDLGFQMDNFDAHARIYNLGVDNTASH